MTGRQAKCNGRTNPQARLTPFIRSRILREFGERGKKWGCPGTPVQIWPYALTHPAPASGMDGKALARPRMSDGGFRPVTSDWASQCRPFSAVFLRESAQGAKE